MTGELHRRMDGQETRRLHARQRRQPRLRRGRVTGEATHQPPVPGQESGKSAWRATGFARVERFVHRQGVER